jgi:hypothetical protein
VDVYDVTGIVIGFLLMAGLIFVISRKRMQWAKWVFIFINVVSVAAFVASIEGKVTTNFPMFLLGATQHFIMFVAMALLFSHGAKQYLWRPLS